MENEMETGILRSSSAPEIQLAHPGIVPTWHAYRIHNHAASAWLTAGLKAHQGTVCLHKTCHPFDAAASSAAATRGITHAMRGDC